MIKSISENLSNKWRRWNKKSKRNFTVAVYAVILAAIVAVVGIGYQAPLSDSVGKSLSDQKTTETVESTTTTSSNTYIDQVSEAKLAVSVAETASLSVEGLVLERAVTAEMRSELVSTEVSTIIKPIILTGDDNNALANYITADGDTVSGLSRIFGVSEQTIKWANNLTGDVLPGGTNLTIPSVDGVVYKVKDGDSLESIVGKYGSSINQILAINNIDGIIAGETIVLPDGALPVNERPGYVAPVVTSYFYAPAYGSYTGSSRFLYVNSKGTTPGNRHYYGNCTWFAWEYRLEIGRGLPAVALGNGGSWHVSLGNMGYRVDRNPAVGAVQDSPGHVAVVVAVSGDSVTVREMNAMGYNVVSERTMSMAQAVQYLYIH